MFNSLFRKLVAVLLLFGLLMSVIFMMIMRYSHDVYHQEVQQKFHAGVAQRFAAMVGGRQMAGRIPAPLLLPF